MCFQQTKRSFSNITEVDQLQIGVTSNSHLCLLCLAQFCKIECCDLDENLVRMQIQRNKAEEKTLKNIPDPFYSYHNGECEFVRSVLPSYIIDNLPDDLV